VKVLWTEQAWEDYLHWQQSAPEVLDKINSLIKDIQRDPFKGLGKPEPLKGPRYAGWWSRRVTDEHRLVYRVRGQSDAQLLEIGQCRYHY
jgi:toxin YoeB